MSFRNDRLPLDPGHAKPVCPALYASGRKLDRPCHHNTQRFPALVVHRHPQPPLDGGKDDTETIRGVSQVVLNPRQAVPPSPVFREGTMTQHGIADELQRLVFDAAGEIHPGMSIKSQLNAACDNLGYPRGHWRVRQAWYGEARNWRSEFTFELLGRYNNLVLKRKASGSRPAPAVDPFTALVASAARR